MDVEEIVALSVKHNVSDLHLCSDSPPRWRRSGRLEPAPFPPPEVDTLLKAWLNDEQQGTWWANGQVDFAVTLAGNQRLRGSAFKQTSGVSMTLRLLPGVCPQLSVLGVPRVVPELLSSDNGLILVTGATGSGKSTTLAAMVDFLNHHTDGHILTLEDPVEFLYQSERCLIQQREIGQHSPSFADALRGALRQDPDVILLGELRDSETIRLALTAAETGHLVLATLHTRGAAQAIERLVDTFPAQEKDPVRNQLAGSLRAVLAQKLLPDAQGGRVALYELLVNTPAAASLIREGKTWQLPGIIQTGQQAGMQNFDQSLAERRAQGQLQAPALNNPVRNSFRE
ncbi:type IV pilus twitching motility protein PilT [Enterobacter ludwigii]|jgi:twitching motility protein PilT|uniref:type IV pilus twitching motility protein PilT n=2 Tax=Enterobacter ludwigii TaxID=299767 RepID=UPI0021C664F8|nr:type IV pilus twitching motility protein PilT [Enterobacter ludwigii]MCU2395937.1 type IV pilus twitching motility protein PilT [Enterobacter ludwigii]MED5734986.1 type IV pilus twitching motility protein PilT [Enterobacter ludwigii]HDR2550309.1 type IV pilus twitching motility protein PilT [Enterobacter ludwigii]HDR2554819.1 type IV pilus twitching motility protein PilT [Enterobacter ludwigii]HDR2568046.1 type IV pilus twitching motility protein PilT [Enterobacter ludwigii]